MVERSLVFGSVGQLLLALSTALYFYITWALSLEGMGLGVSYAILSVAYPVMFMSLISILSWALFLVFAVLFLISGMTAAHGFNGSRAGVVAGILGFIAFGIGIVAMLLASPTTSFAYEGFLLLFAIHIFRGATAILVGSFLRSYGKLFSNGGLWRGTGLSYEVFGILEATGLLSMLGMFVLIITAILGSICFLNARRASM